MNVCLGRKEKKEKELSARLVTGWNIPCSTIPTETKSAKQCVLVFAETTVWKTSSPQPKNPTRNPFSQPVPHRSSRPVPVILWFTTRPSASRRDSDVKAGVSLACGFSAFAAYTSKEDTWTTGKFMQDLEWVYSSGRDSGPWVDDVIYVPPRTGFTWFLQALDGKDVMFWMRELRRFP